MPGAWCLRFAVVRGGLILEEEDAQDPSGGERDPSLVGYLGLHGVFGWV